MTPRTDAHWGEPHLVEPVSRSLRSGLLSIAYYIECVPNRVKLPGDLKGACHAVAESRQRSHRHHAISEYQTDRRHLCYPVL